MADDETVQLTDHERYTRRKRQEKIRNRLKRLVSSHLHRQLDGIVEQHWPALVKAKLEGAQLIVGVNEARPAPVEEPAPAPDAPQPVTLEVVPR